MSTVATGLPEGWHVDLADPSVGIFGDAWSHDCLGGSDVEATEGEMRQVNKYLVTTDIILRCKGCGATTTVQQSDFAPEEEGQ